MATITVSNTSQLLSALSSATGGDTIELASGNYGSLDLQNVSFSSTVTIRSADSNNPAVFTDVSLDNVSHLRVDGVKVANGSNGAYSSKIVEILNSDNVEFSNSEVHGPIDNFYDGHYGIFVDDSADIVVSGNDVHDVKNGFVVYNTTGLEISENHVDYIGNDAFKYSGVHDFLIENNSYGGHVYPQSGAHLDFMQFQGAESTNGVIRGNVFLANTKANVQGIFLDDTEFHNILIEDNIIATGMLNGIAIYGTTTSGITVRDNTLINIPGVVHKATKVLGADVSSGNLMGSYTNAEGANVEINTADYDQYFQGDIGLGMTLEDLRPVAGSVAEQYGAYERLLELLDGTAYEPTDPTPTPDAGNDAGTGDSTDSGAIWGSDQADWIGGGSENDELWGKAGDDTIWGAAGDDRIGGGGDSDALWSDIGSDTVWGGGGDDVIGAGTDNDIVSADAGNDTVWGGGGDDVIGAGADNDTVSADAGNDTVYGGTGNDELSGGADQDLINAGSGDDTVYAGDGDDVLIGLDGQDELWGGKGNDTAYGGAGNDVLLGLAGQDELWGGVGADTLNGGAGNDTLRGGSEADSFVFSMGADQVIDFGDGDLIDLSSVAGITDFADLLADHLSGGGNAVIDDGDGNTLTLVGVDADTLEAKDFLF